MSAAFVANGLLSDDNESTPTVGASASILGSGFVSNGLLGEGSSIVQEDASITTNVKSLTFKPSELLESNAFEASTSTQPSYNDTNLSQATFSSTIDTRSSFVSNGLLGEYQAFTPTSLLTDSQDNFPAVSELLHRTTESRPITSTATSDGPLYIPRAPARATTFGGRTFYIKRKTRLTGLSKTSSSAPKISGLLDVPIHRLMDDLSTETALRLSREQGELASARVHKQSRVEETLWVDRYRPLRFTELLGNERVARETMAWVKQWDWCVFGKRKYKGKKRIREDDDNENPDDEFHRPREKLLLVSGPPGLGKTTLAHVVAAQAGYEVMEINASDARSAQVIDDRLKPALESGSAIGSDKPILIVIDEIDGATGGGGDNTSSFVQKLVSLTFDQPKSKRKKQDKGKRPLLRPIICICNDINAHSLAKLRPHARHIRYTRPADIHIVKRLRQICEMEGLKADSRALSTLVGVAKGDLRGCLNTLQFIRSRNEDVTEPLIRRSTAGMKEADTTANSVLNDIFAPMSKKRVKELGMGEEEEGRYVNRLSRTIEGMNNFASIATGCFAHYINCHRHDADLSRYGKANDWLTTYDLFASTMYQDGDFGLHSYLSYLLVPFHPLFKARGGQRVERDTTDWEHLQRTRGNEDIYKTLASNILTASSRNCGAYRHLITGQALQLEFAPFINRIISPPLRPVNRQIIKAGERELLKRLVDIMVAMELRFIQEKSEEGTLSFRLDPPIDVFVTYDSKRAADISVSRYAVRQLVAGEIDNALIARHADAIERSKTKPQNFFSKQSERHEDGEHEGRNVHDADGELRRLSLDGSGPIKRQRIEAQEIEEKPPVDFFGRPIAVPTSGSHNKPTSKKVLKRDYHVSYRFLEGNSAAVRKPVKVSSFL